MIDGNAWHELLKELDESELDRRAMATELLEAKKENRKLAELFDQQQDLIGLLWELNPLREQLNKPERLRTDGNVVK